MYEKNQTANTNISKKLTKLFLGSFLRLVENTLSGLNTRSLQKMVQLIDIPSKFQKPN